MKRSLIILSVFSACLLLTTATAAQSKAEAFTGYWLLDREKSSTDKDFPFQLKDYRMLVTESGDTLDVKNQVAGDVEVRKATRGDTGPSVQANSGSSRSTGGGYGVTASSGVSSGSGTSTNAAYGGTMALYMTPGEISYDLTGKEVKVEPKPGEKLGGTRMKAKLSKDGKTIELTTWRKMTMGGQAVEVVSRETWRVAEDGKSMRFTRSIETPAFRDEINMFMTRKQQQ